MMTVSIITIFLNAERFLDEAIRSVLAQTYGGWELLLVDDGSTDGSSGIARAYAASDPQRVRYLAHPGGVNRGMSRSRQLGIEHASGDCIAFLDADDVYLPEKLERQLVLLERYPRAAMIYGPTPHWFGDVRLDEAMELQATRRLGVPADSLVEPPELVRQFLRRTADPPATCGVLIRRRAVDATGGFEEQFRGLYEDQVFFFKVCLAFPVFVEGRAWDRYRRHPGSYCEVQIRAGTHSDDYSPTEPRGTFLRWLDEYVRSRPVGDGELQRLLDRELWPYRHPALHRLAIHARARARALGLGRISHAARRGWRRLFGSVAASR